MKWCNNPGECIGFWSATPWRRSSFLAGVRSRVLGIATVFGHQLIADPGPDRGARSALAKVLKGTLPAVPRMPLNQPPLSSDQIQYIES